MVGLIGFLALNGGLDILRETPTAQDPTVQAPPSAATGEQGAEGEPASATPGIPADAGEAVVRYVHDGDTLFLEDGRKVRLLGIDTPEIGDNLECFGDEATEALRAMLPPGTSVRTFADVNPLDRFGRSLLFLFTTGGTLINLELVRQGYAEVLVIEPNVLWTAELETAERDAVAAGLGLWGSC